jgi:hypothetical protein
MSAEFLKTLYRQRSPLLEHVLRFNLRPLTDLHADRLADLVGTWVTPPGRARIAASRLGWRRLCQWAADSGRLPDGRWLDFREPRHRLALLDGASLDRLTLLVGAAACHPLLSRFVLGEEVRQLKDRLGPDVYAFALGTAPFLVGPAPEHPGLDRIDPIPTPVADPAVTLRLMGRAYVRHCLHDAPEPLWQRLESKLPPAPGPLPGPFTFAPDRAWRLVYRVLTREAAPQWAPCFV